MGCPVHIWLPLIAAALPFTRAARDRIRATKNRLLTGSSEEPVIAPGGLKRWAPISSNAGRPANSETAGR